MRQTYYQAYQKILEAEKNRKAKKIEIENKQIKPFKIKRTVGNMNKPENRVEHEVEYNDEKDDKLNEIVRPSQNGLPTDGKSRKFIRAKDLNSKFRAEIKSPFVSEKGKSTIDSGIFSSDENSVASAISKGIPTNKQVKSRELSRMNYYNIGMLPDNFVEDVGMVDALVWQCWNGNYNNVKLILKNGYDVPKSYSGMNPITAAIDGRNIEVLKIVLSIPKISDLINKKDGLGNYPIESVSKIKGIDPYEFAKILIEAGARDDVRTTKEYNAAMLSLLNGCWTPNLFGELLPVTDLEKKGKGGLNLRGIAEKLGNREAVMMIDNFVKYSEESINQSVTHSNIISHI